MSTHELNRDNLLKMVIKLYYQENITNTQFETIENIICGYSIAGRMLKYIEEPNALIGEIKSIQHACNEVITDTIIKPTEFVNKILSSGYSNIINYYMENKYNYSYKFNESCCKYMKYYLNISQYN